MPVIPSHQHLQAMLQHRGDGAAFLNYLAGRGGDAYVEGLQYS